MLVMEQVARLLTGAGLGTIGTNVFVHHMPETCRQGLLVLGRLTGEDINWDLPAYRRNGFQIIARSITPILAEGLIRSAMVAVSFTGWQNLPAAGVMTVPVPVLFIRARHEPIIYPRSDGDLVEASVNFEFACKA